MQLVGAYRLMYAATPASRLEEGDCAVRGVLLDGFPRTRRQAEMLGDLGVEVTHTLILDMPDEVVISRVSGRRIDPLSGKIYHIHFNPPETEAVANRLIQREDDTRTKIMRRLEGYHSNKAAIAEYYGDLVSTVRFAPPGTIAKGGLGAPARRSLALDAKPMLVHDELRKVCCIVCVCACASSGTVGRAQRSFHSHVLPRALIPCLAYTQVIEGARYWGSVIDSNLLVKYNECGNAVRTQICS